MASTLVARIYAGAIPGLRELVTLRQKNEVPWPDFEKANNALSRALEVIKRLTAKNETKLADTLGKLVGKTMKEVSRVKGASVIFLCFACV